MGEAVGIVPEQFDFSLAGMAKPDIAGTVLDLHGKAGIGIG